MTPGREVSDAVVRCVPIDQVLEMTVWDEVQQLRENRSATIHGVASFAKQIGKHKAKTPPVISNRRNHQPS
jgi:putative hemolysin